MILHVTNINYTINHIKKNILKIYRYKSKSIWTKSIYTLILKNIKI
jgi:hypothetical protein